MKSKVFRLVTLFVGCCTLACLGPPEIVHEPLLQANVSLFEEEVQPLLADRCGNPNCHGNAGRPFEIFSVHQHRLDTTEVYMDQQINSDELWLNIESARAFIEPETSAQGCLLIRKPLSEDAGGASHGGGRQFHSLTDVDTQILLRWVSASLSMGHEEMETPP